MRLGDVLDGRFEIQRPVGKGGMGTVFYATDRVAGCAVAVKLLDFQARGAVERFKREARVLSELAHPCIVSYVAHGETPDHKLFLVMTWLEGEDLGTRLKHGPLDVEQSLELARRLSDGLAHAHRRGVVHRDLKPNNVFLVDYDPARAMLLDFGVARVTETHSRTKTGTLLGTVGYMAPEQALDSAEIDTRADVFGLGCVLFECLTGRPAFTGPHELAVLAKLLRGETPRLADHRPDLGPGLDSLLRSLLAHDAEQRPADGEAVRSMLDALETTSGRSPTIIQSRVESARPRPSRSVLTGQERRVQSVVLAEIPSGQTADTLQAPATPSVLAARFGADLTWLPAGQLLLAFGGARSAADLAGLAVSCALELRNGAPGARVAIATGMADTGSEAAIGPVIDRVALLLAESETGRVAIDEVTAGLLHGRFDVSERAGKYTAERASAKEEQPRSLMGKKTPWVGRERELVTLEALLDECVTDSVRRSAVVVGDAGMGKTRLRQEFVARVRNDRPRVTILAARGELVAASSPLAVARQLVRSAFELEETTPPAEASRRIRSDLERTLARAPPEERRRIGDFLGELLDVEHPEEPSIQLAAGREDASLMGQWLKKSFIGWIGALAADGPLLIVLDDLHWADLATITWLSEVLRGYRDVPLLVLGFGRPEVRTRPRSFPDQQEIPLTGLARRAAEQLLRAVLPDSSDEDMQRLVEQSEGNAFYLEELARHLAAGAKDLPPTVLAMAQARLEQLDSGARAVLRVASVLGERFWAAPIEAVFGEREGDVRRWLELLCSEEVISQSASSRFAGEEEYAFRHALMREAASAALTNEDRQSAHRIASEWLVAAGETDALVILGHFERAGEAARAGQFYLRAVERASDAADAPLAIAFARRGLDAGVGGEERPALLAKLAFALHGDGRNEEARAAALEALNELLPGAKHWRSAVSALVVACLQIGDGVTPLGYLFHLADIEPEPFPSADLIQCEMSAQLALSYLGQPAMSKASAERADRLGRDADRAPVVRAVWHICRSFRAYFDPDAFPSGYNHACQAIALADELGYSLAREQSSVYAARNALFMGKTDAARVELGHAAATKLGAIASASPATMLAIMEGDLAAAEAAAAPALGGPSAVIETAVRTLLAFAYAGAERVEEAVRVMDGMPAATDALLGLRADLHMARARIELARGNGQAALAECDLGDQATEQWGSLVFVRHLLALTRVEAHDQLGQSAEANRLLTNLRTELHDLASKMDADVRQSYLVSGFPSARILDLARRRLGAE